MSECEYASTDTPARYRQKKLDGAEAESFEAHYFACDACWIELESLTSSCKLSRPWLSSSATSDNLRAVANTR